jgi:hypothetical protein
VTGVSYAERAGLVTAVVLDALAADKPVPELVGELHDLQREQGRGYLHPTRPILELAAAALGVTVGAAGALLP